MLLTYRSVEECKMATVLSVKPQQLMPIIN